MARRSLSSSAKQRQLAGSRRGSSVVQEQFDAVITRRRFCELVGVHSTTLAKWEKRGVLKPRLETILNSPTRVFTDEDVVIGKAVLRLLRDRPGTLSVEDAARMARDAAGR